MDRKQLEVELERHYDADAAVRRVVARQARDLADSGRIREDLGFQLDAEDVLENLEDAPDDYALAERWNWWLGALELAHGGYRQFQIERVPVDDADRPADESSQ